MLLIKFRIKINCVLDLVNSCFILVIDIMKDILHAQYQIKLSSIMSSKKQLKIKDT